MFKRIVVFLISFLLIVNSTLINAATVGAWNVFGGATAIRASMLYEAMKGTVQSSVLITPSSADVSKILKGGLGGVALGIAVDQLLGAVDWVMDPENNQIRYREKEDTILNNNILPPWAKIGYTSSFSSPSINKNFTNTLEACNYATILQAYWWSVNSVSITSIEGNQCHIRSNTGIVGTISLVVFDNPAYDPNAKQKTLPLETIAQQIIENAQNNDVDAQFAILAATNAILSEAEKDDAKAKPIEDELEKNSKCPSGIISEYGQCWIYDKDLFFPMYRATKDAKFATRNKSCKNITDPAIKAANAVLFRNLISARSQENACWSPIHQNHITALNDAKNALILCEN